MVRAADQRVSDAERDEVVDLLRRAAGEGRIGHDELDERVARALRAQTYRELNLTIADIPRPRGERRTPVTRSRKVGGWALTAVRNEPWLLVFVIPMVAVAMTLMLAALMMWIVVAIAMLALGGHHRETAQMMHQRPRRPLRGPRGLVGSAGRWI